VARDSDLLRKLLVNYGAYYNGTRTRRFLRHAASMHQLIHLMTELSRVGSSSLGHGAENANSPVSTTIGATFLSGT
jgi:hypothetical protein